jgi:exopolysaccharide biosynthesis WecB/TagA/CpsF family protein
MSGDGAPRREPSRPPALVFGVPVADVTMDETIRLIGDLVDEGRRTATSSQVSTVNVDFLVNAMCDPDVARILKRAELCIPDGMPVVWGARMLGMPLRERVAGVDLVQLLVGASCQTGWRIHVFGSMPDVASAAERLLRERYPGARFSVDPGPILHDVDVVDDRVLDSIVAADADILCVALGNPKQERFIAAHRERLRCPVMIGVGGSLDLLVGRRRRAPRWMRAVGLEWAFRTAQEPARLGRRYARDFLVFAPAFANEWRRSRRRRGAGLSLATECGGVVAEVAGAGLPSEPEWSIAVAALFDGGSLTVLGDPPTVGDQAMAQLVGLLQIARRCQSQVRIDVPIGTVERWAGEHHLDPHLFDFPAS